MMYTCVLKLYSVCYLTILLSPPLLQANHPTAHLPQPLHNVIAAAVFGCCILQSTRYCPKTLSI